MVPLPSHWKKAAGIFLLLHSAIFPLHAQLTNAALGKTATASGAVYDAQRAPGMITDGSASTFSHPAVPVAPATHSDAQTPKEASCQVRENSWPT